MINAQMQYKKAKISVIHNRAVYLTRFYKNWSFQKNLKKSKIDQNIIIILSNFFCIIFIYLVVFLYKPESLRYTLLLNIKINR